jgi:hypothetical protein
METLSNRHSIAMTTLSANPMAFKPHLVAKNATALVDQFGSV